jgi:hypothetical protein
VVPPAAAEEEEAEEVVVQAAVEVVAAVEVAREATQSAPKTVVQGVRAAKGAMAALGEMDQPADPVAPPARGAVLLKSWPREGLLLTVAFQCEALPVLMGPVQSRANQALVTREPMEERDRFNSQVATVETAVPAAAAA